VREGAWTLTTRAGSQVEHERLASLDEAVAALERVLRELAPSALREEVNLIGRRIEPVRQVAARLEISGPRRDGRGSVRGGIDLRGDGSAEAFTGRLRRAVLERQEGESAPAALARALAT
jgi:hypothetical protein